MPSPLEQVISALDQFDNVELAYIRSVAASHMDRRTPQTPPIFKLPQELRDEIYHHLAFAFFNLHTSEDVCSQDSLALLRVNKRIHAEFINVFYGSTYFRGLLIDEVANGQRLSATLPLKLVQKIIERRGGREAKYYPKRNVLMATFNFKKEEVLMKVHKSTLPSETNTQQTEVSFGNFLGTMVKRKRETSQPVQGYVELLSMPERCCYIAVAPTSQNSTLEGCIHLSLSKNLLLALNLVSSPPTLTIFAPRYLDTTCRWTDLLDECEK